MHKEPHGESATTSIALADRERRRRLSKPNDGGIFMVNECGMQTQMKGSQEDKEEMMGVREKE